MNTIIVNLFGGPGTGKSTGAAYIFSKLKMNGVDAEYVTEFAKDKVWEENKSVFSNQFYITGKQVHRIKRVYGKVEVIITDSPILLGMNYCPNDKPCLKKAILEEFKSYGQSNLNIFLARVKKYNPNGRNQTEEEAKALDADIYQALRDNGIEFYKFEGSESGYDDIVDFILTLLHKKGDTTTTSNPITQTQIEREMADYVKRMQELEIKVGRLMSKEIKLTGKPFGVMSNDDLIADRDGDYPYPSGMRVTYDKELDQPLAPEV